MFLRLILGGLRFGAANIHNRSYRNGTRQARQLCRPESSEKENNMPIRRVDPSSPAAYPTITQALSSAASGDVILVAGGSYRESPVVRLSVSIRPQNQEQPLVLIGSIGVEGTAADLRLTGCTIQESVGSGLTVSEGAKATLGNCTLTNNRKYGIEVQAGGTLEARQCSVGGNLDAGVVAAGVVRLADCVVSNNQSPGRRSPRVES